MCQLAHLDVLKERGLRSTTVDRELEVGRVIDICSDPDKMPYKMSAHSVDFEVRRLWITFVWFKGIIFVSMSLESDAQKMDKT